MAQLSQGTLDAFLTLDDQKKENALRQMTPAQRQLLLGQIQSRRGGTPVEQTSQAGRVSIPAGAEIRGPLSWTERAINFGRDALGLGKKVADFAAEEGPPMIGAAIGAAAGIPAGPGGIVAGAAFGATGARALQRGIQQLGGAEFDPEDLASDYLTQMILGPLQEAAPIVRGAMGLTQGTARGLTSRAQALGAEFDVPLDIAQQTQNPFWSRMRTLLQRTLTGGPTMEKFTRVQSAAANQAGQLLSKSISKIRLTARQAGEVVKFLYNDYDEFIKKEYETAINAINEAGGSTALIPSEKVANKARAIIDDLEGSISKAPELGKIESINDTLNTLKGFAGWRQTTTGVRKTPVQRLETEVAGDVVETAGTRQLPIRQLETEVAGEAVDVTGRRVTPVIGLKPEGGGAPVATGARNLPGTPVTPERSVSGLGRPQFPGQRPGVLRAGGNVPAGQTEVVAQRVSDISGPRVETPGTVIPESVSYETVPISGPQVQLPSSIVPRGITDVVETTIDGPEIIKPVTFDEARRLRSLLLKITDLPELNLGRSRIKEMTGALDKAMEEGLVNAGLPQAARSFRKFSTRYRMSRANLDNTIIRQAALNDSPEVILGTLLGAKSESAFTAFNSISKRNPGLRDGVRRSAWDYILDVSKTEDVLVGGSLESTLKGMGDDALRVVFGPELPRVKRFAELVDQLSLPKSITRPGSEQSMSLIAQNAGAALAAGATTMFYNPALGAFIIGSITVPPWLMARYLTRPGAVDVAIRAMQTPLSNKAGVGAATRMMNLITRGIQDVQRDTQREEADD